MDNQKETERELLAIVRHNRAAWVHAFELCIAGELQSGPQHRAAYWQYQLDAFAHAVELLDDLHNGGIYGPSDGEVYEAVSRQADPAAHDAAVAESLALFGSSAVLTPEHKAAQQGLNAAASQRLESVTVTDKDGWIRVKDQKPPFDQLVLVYKEDASKRTDVRWGVAERRRGGRYNPQEWLVEVPWEWAPIGTPTHWRPLPLLPGAQAVGVDPSKRTPDLYTCIGKGGSYELLDVALGAGTSRDKSVVLYRDTENGALYFRTPDDFDKRMQKIEDPA